MKEMSQKKDATYVPKTGSKGSGIVSPFHDKKFAAGDSAVASPKSMKGGRSMGSKR